MSFSGWVSTFAGFRFPHEMITIAVCWYLRYGLSYSGSTQSGRTLTGIESPAACHTGRWPVNRDLSSQGSTRSTRELGRSTVSGYDAAGGPR